MNFVSVLSMLVLVASGSAPTPAPQCEAATVDIIMNRSEPYMVEGTSGSLDEAARLSRRPGCTGRVVITAQTDTIGTDQQNQALSQDWGDLIKSELIARGIRRQAITVEGLGEAPTRLYREDNISELGDRRVSIVIS